MILFWINLENVPDLFDEVERPPLRDGVDQDHPIRPGKSVKGGKVVVVFGAEITDFKENRFSVHHHLVLVSGLWLVIILSNVTFCQKPHY